MDGPLQVFCAGRIFHGEHAFRDEFTSHRADDVDAEDFIVIHRTGEVHLMENREFRKHYTETGDNE